MKRFNRSDRVSHLIHREVSEIIDHELRDERIGMVTVTGVDVSKDLRNAKIYVSILGTENDIKDSMKALNAATGFIRTTLGSRVILKYLPTISFQHDTSTINGMHIDKLLEKIKKET
ncbi:MAG: 30S ribosome-binding factor RbfA [Candidatus Latescibacteria bacterium]|nr:30S ribosome-binding factor RbfA [Candidatus Latescibacterota bacterium]